MTTQVDVFLAHHGVFENNEVDIFLAHHGVPGMKWGRRKAQQAGTGIANAARSVKGHYVNNANAALERNGGSKAKTITKAVGKDFVTSLGLAVGQKGLDVAISALPGNHPLVRAGSAKAFQILQIGTHANTAAKITAIATRPKKE